MGAGMIAAGPGAPRAGAFNGASNELGAFESVSWLARSGQSGQWRSAALAQWLKAATEDLGLSERAQQSSSGGAHDC